jgi:hypothetical protein
VVFTNTDSHSVHQIINPGEEIDIHMKSFITSSDWKIAISHKWLQQEHINGLEVRSSLSAIRWSMKRPDVSSFLLLRKVAHHRIVCYDHYVQ